MDILKIVDIKPALQQRISRLFRKSNIYFIINNGNSDFISELILQR